MSKLKTIFFAASALALLGVSACKDPSDGTGGGNIVPPEAPFVEGGASLILSRDRLDIKVTVTTADGTSVTVEGCTETTLISGTATVLHAKSTKVILKGKITELDCNRNQLTALNVQGLTALQVLDCGYNQLTALDVQGLTALQGLYCGSNQLNADAFKKLFDDLPQRTANAGAQCYLYTERSGVIEGNHRDFTSPGELKTAFDNAKTVKNWKMYKRNMNDDLVDLE